MIARNGWDDVVYTHISASVPGEPGRFLINPFGLVFDEVTASKLVKIDIDGNVIGESAHPVNATGFALHAAVHAARPDAACVMHLHVREAIAVSAQPHGLLPGSQHAMRFHGHLAYHDYESLAFSPSEGERLVASLGAIAEAYVLMDMFVKACDIQLRALAGVSKMMIVPPPEIAARRKRSASSSKPSHARHAKRWAANCPPVDIILTNVKRENWATAGKLWSEQ